MIDFLSAALRYAELGYAVFPCKVGSKDPLTKNGFYNATTDSVLIERWWELHPQANIGIATGKLFVVDIDGSDNPWPPPNEPLFGGAVSMTPSGGRHILFLSPDEGLRNTTGTLAEKVDTRGTGGYIVAPPSVKEDGDYKWAPTLALSDPVAQLPVLPHDIVEKLLSGTNGTGNLNGKFNDQIALIDSEPIPKGERNDSLFRLGCKMRRFGMDQSEIKAALLSINMNRCTPMVDVKEIDKIAWSASKYEPDQNETAEVLNHYESDRSSKDKEELLDPGPIPYELMRVPGFINEVIDYCLDTAPYPNPAMAFGGALALQAYLGGRKVRDDGDNRTNLYLLGLGHSASGKDWPRRVNTHIMNHMGAMGALGDKFASGEGLEDVICRNKSMLFQTDEIDGMLQSIVKSKDARFESIMSALLRLYSSASSMFPMRQKAGEEEALKINQPCLVLFGTAIPNHYYESLSERMLTNGFFSRFLVIESGKRSRGQKPKIIDIPRRILEQASYWYQFGNDGNLDDENPRPAIVPTSAAAEDLLTQGRDYADDEYEKCEDKSDPIGTTVWGRFNEQVRKLALVYSISENPTDPEIGTHGVEWSIAIVRHQVERMLYQASELASDGPFDALKKKAIKNIKESEKQKISHSVLLRKMKISAKDFTPLIATLLQTGQITQATENKSKYYKVR